jgi:hypothetical protein
MHKQSCYCFEKIADKYKQGMCASQNMPVYINYLYKLSNGIMWPHDSPVEGEEPYLFWGH